MARPPPVKVGACRALSQLLPEVNKEIIQPQLLSLLSSLTSLLNQVICSYFLLIVASKVSSFNNFYLQASDETLHLVLETLQAAVNAGNFQIISVFKYE